MLSKEWFVKLTNIEGTESYEQALRLVQAMQVAEEAFESYVETMNEWLNSIYKDGERELRENS